MSTSRLPSIIYGTAWKKERTTSLVVTAVLQGFRAIDTACQPKHYREDLVGEGLQELYDEHDIKREDLYIQTKFTPISGQDTSQPIPYDPKASIEDQLVSSLALSLKNLCTDYIDAYLLHSPLPGPVSNTLKAWRVLARFQDEKKARLIGVCNTYDPRVLESLSEERKVQVVQNRWYEGNNWDKEVVGWCKKNGAMYQSFWTLSGSTNLLSHKPLIIIAKVNKITPEQALFKFARMNGVVPLTGTTSVEHMKHDLEVEDIEFKPNEADDEVAEVTTLVA